MVIEKSENTETQSTPKKEKVKPKKKKEIDEKFVWMPCSHCNKSLQYKAGLYFCSILIIPLPLLRSVSEKVLGRFF